jgi:hypothetical protein
MIVVIAAGILGLWLAGNDRPTGWGLAAAAHLLWLPYALAAGQPGLVLAVVAFGLICLLNCRRNSRTRRGSLTSIPRRRW